MRVSEFLHTEELAPLGEAETIKATMEYALDQGLFTSEHALRKLSDPKFLTIQITALSHDWRIFHVARLCLQISLAHCLCKSM